jgi:hypothetical protein
MRLMTTCEVAQLILISAASLAAQAPPSPANLFRAIKGNWSCAGGFARGGALSADLAFQLIGDGHAVSFTHIDRSPGLYWQHAVWAAEPKTGHIISVGIAGAKADFTGTPVSFAATNWSATDVMLVADTSRGPTSVPNRFEYSLLREDSLKMRWEILRNGAWMLGDSLLCARSR